MEPPPGGHSGCERSPAPTAGGGPPRLLADLFGAPASAGVFGAFSSLLRGIAFACTPFSSAAVGSLVLPPVAGGAPFLCTNHSLAFGSFLVTACALRGPFVGPPARASRQGGDGPALPCSADRPRMTWYAPALPSAALGAAALMPRIRGSAALSLGVYGIISVASLRSALPAMWAFDRFDSWQLACRRSRVSSGMCRGT